MKTPSVGAIQKRIRALGRPTDAARAARFHKTGPGEYAQGVVFIGLNAATLRSLAREYRDLPLETVESLLHSPIHDERTVAVLILVSAMVKADDAVRKQIFDLYLANLSHVNSWALVDCSAPGIVGAYLANRKRTILDRLAKSKSLWERRVSIVATQWLIRLGEFDDTLRIATKLLGDKEDLIHKATGWMLREVGKRDQAVLEAFLRRNLPKIPRTTLRYAIERFPEPLRKAYLNGSFDDRITQR